MEVERMDALRHCPNCGDKPIRAVSDGEDTNFLCLSCGHCWHIELGWLHRVDPTTCPGCAGQPVCTAALRCSPVTAAR